MPPKSSRAQPGLPLPLSGRTELYAIIGDPIAQAGSPAAFNSAFRQSGRQAVLVPAHVSASGLASFITGLRQVQNLRGLIITKPHKIAILPFVDRLEPHSSTAGAVNAISCGPDGIWVGDNFDGQGCMTGLREAGHDLRGRRVLLLGTGGAGRAVAFAMAQSGISAMRLFDVDEAGAERCAAELRTAVPGVTMETGQPDPSGFDVVVNCTPLGMAAGDPLPLDPSRLKPGSLVIDLVIEPEMTPLLRAAAARNCRIHAGRLTLHGQVAAIVKFFS